MLVVGNHPQNYYGIPGSTAPPSAQGLSSLVLSFLLSASNYKLCCEQMLTCRMLIEPVQLDCLVHLQDCPIEDVIHALLTWFM